MQRVLIAVAAALTLTACETATPYQPAVAVSGVEHYGFADEQIEGDRWRVEFSGNSETPKQTVERYLLYRAAQLTIQQGYDWFQTVDRHTERQTDYFGDDFGGFYGPGFGYGGGFGRGFGGGYGGFGYGGFGYGGFGYGGFGGGDFDVEQINRYRSNVEILLRRGPKPGDNPRAYDARSVVAHLEGKIRLPKA